MVSAVLSGETTIARGPAKGMRFDAGGGRPGYGLGTWEPAVQDALSQLATRGGVVYDIGAASGFFTLIAARSVTDSGTVVAFEPLPPSVALLRENVNRNGLDQVQIHELALGATDREDILVEGRDVDQAALTSAPRGKTQRGERTTVKVTTVDQLVRLGQVPPPTLIKMDIEGAEIEALQGARKTIDSFRPTLLVEVHDCWAEFEALMDDFGYSYEIIDAAESADHAVARPGSR